MLRIRRGNAMKSDDIKATANDAAARAGAVADSAADKVSAKASGISDAAGTYASSAAEAATDAYASAKAKLSDAASQLPGSASDAIEAGRNAYATGSDQIVRQVAKQPIEALLLAGAIGFLVGWAANRG